MSSKVPEIHLQSFASLPNPKRVWVGERGSDEEGLGRLVLLTEEVVNEAAKTEIRTGKRIGMNWDITKLEHAPFGRVKPSLEILMLEGDLCFDDVYHMNPQQSSQWDGMRHHGQRLNENEKAHPDNWVFYNGMTAADIKNPDNKRIGIHHWAKKGMAGRAVLLDYVEYAAKHNISYSTFSQHQISLKDLKQIAIDSNITFKRGDILLVRSGMTKEWDAMTEEQKRSYGQNPNPKHAGVEASIEMAAWLWDSGFSAVAGDAISWEVFPGLTEFSLHEYLLAGWGMPIGEMFDLEELAKLCKEQNRWSFFFTSMPLNMPGGVSSPPNAMAIF